MNKLKNFWNKNKDKLDIYENGKGFWVIIILLLISAFIREFFY